MLKTITLSLRFRFHFYNLIRHIPLLHHLVVISNGNLQNPPVVPAVAVSLVMFFPQPTNLLVGFRLVHVDIVVEMVVGIVVILPHLVAEATHRV